MSKDEKVIVITAGGTVEAIDGVRSIRNTSSGKLGANIADVLKNQWKDARIIYLANRHAVRPQTEHSWIETTSVLDVEEKIRKILENEKVDIFIHSMAVADYFVEGVELEDGRFIDTATLQTGKLSSDGESMKVVLKRAPKIISLIKKIQPLVYLVGFKLLNDTTEENLFNVGFNLLRKNRCNLVIANDLTHIRSGEHRALFIVPEKKSEKVNGKAEISKHLAALLEHRAFCKHSKSNRLSENVSINEQSLNEMKQVGAELFKEGLLPTVEGGTYGNLSTLTNNGYLMTGRNVHKGDLNKEIVCHIEECLEVNKESVYAHVNYHGKVKPSIDSAIHGAIYRKVPEAKAILHVHTDDYFNKPLSSYNYPCGTMEERDSIVNLISKEEPIIQMKKHGLIILDESLTDCLKQLKSLFNELHLTPFVEEKHSDVWNEWINHLKEVGGSIVEEDILNFENYRVIQEGEEVYGLCYMKYIPLENVLKFCIYTSIEYQRSGKSIGSRTLDILEQIARSEGLYLELVTRKACSVVEFYKKKGFKIFKDESLISMRKEV